MLPYDNYGRTVTSTTTNNIDSYAVSDGATTIYFTLMLSHEEETKPHTTK